MLIGLRYSNTCKLSLCFRDTGSSGPPVVFLHGTTANLGVWDPVADQLGNQIRAIAIDQRGHGRSDKPSTGYAAADYCSDVLALVSELGCAPVVIAGHSLGARNAIVLGATHPELVAGVVAVDYTPYVETQVLDDLETRVRSGDREFRSKVEVEEYLRRRYPLIPDAALRRRVAYGHVEVGDSWHALADPSAMVQTVDGLRQDFADEMRQIKVPMTVMRGEESKIVSRAAFDATKTLRPDVRTIELSGVDHYIPEESPGTVADEIAQMLQRIA